MVDGLQKRYGNKQILKDIDLQVEEGSIFALLGENGAGKTTTVRILSTLINADGGTAYIDGFDCQHQPQSIKKRISLTGQYATVDEQLTGEENLILIGRLLHLDKKTANKRITELLELFDLSSHAKKLVKTYSGGMLRKLDIAISLLASPKVIFLDEPTTGLDPRSRQNMWEMVKGLAADGVTIFLTTQYLEEAEVLADKIAVLHGGRIIAEGSSEQLKSLVGEEKLVWVFSEETSLARAQSLLGGELNEAENILVTNSDGSIEDLRQTLNIFHEQGIIPTSFHYRNPTIQDVFMVLTDKNEKEGVAV